MIKDLKFKEIIETIIDEINDAKKKSKKIYNAGNIKSSGDEVEDLIREKISLFLPERYMVKQGHLVNSQGKVSNQLDIIIFDRFSTPKFFESKNKTVFYPIESVLAIGEIKKTLRNNDIIEFSKKIKFIKEDMERELVENTTYDGITGKTLLSDVVNMETDRKFKNPLFSFIFAIDVDDFTKIKINDSGKFLPNDTYIMNYGSLIYGDLNNKYIETYVEDENPQMNTWLKIEKPGINCIAMMFNQIINHLNKCFVEPFSISHYMSEEDFKILGRDIKVLNLEES